LTRIENKGEFCRVFAQKVGKNGEVFSYLDSIVNNSTQWTSLHPLVL